MSRQHSYRIGLAVGSAGLVLALTVSAQGAKDGLLTGTITSTSGQPIEGVTVSAQIAGEPITASVYTGADGRYFFPTGFFLSSI